MLPAARFREDHAAAGLVPEEAVGRVDDRRRRAVRGKEAERVVEVDVVAGHASLVDAPRGPGRESTAIPTRRASDSSAGNASNRSATSAAVIESRAARAEARAGTAPTATDRKEMRMSARLAEDNGGERLGDLLDRAAEPGRVALVTAETGETLSYEGLTAAAASLAGRLATLGVGRGSRIALVLPDGPDFLQLLLAVTRLGAIAAPLNPAYKRDEYEFYLDDLQPQLLLVPVGELPAAREASQPTSRWSTCRAREGRSGCRRARQRSRTSARSSRPSRTTSRSCCTRAARRAARSRCRCCSATCRLRADDRRLLRARPRRRLLLRDAALPRARPRRLDLRRARRRRLGRRRRDGSRRGAFWPQAREPRRHVVLGRADAPPDDPRARSTAAARPRRSASRARAARRCPRR